MEGKAYKILTSSHKGGVGKTIISINVAAALHAAGYEVLLIDTDAANPSIGPLLGLHNATPGFAEIVEGKAKVEETLIEHEPSGLYLIPAGGSGEALEVDTNTLTKFYEKLDKSKAKFDFVIVDTPPGAALAGELKTFDEALVVTLPEETAVLGAQKLSQKFTNKHLLHKLVINRVKGDKYELKEEDIERMYGDVASAMLPEDESIEESEVKHLPAYQINPKSLFSIAIDDLIRSYKFKAGEPQEASEGFRKDGLKGVKKFFGVK